MADRLVVMSEGAVRQVGSQRDLYERPADRFVAGFVGRSSFIRGRMRGERLVTAGGLEVVTSGRTAGDAVIALRPERVLVGPRPVAAENSFEGEVEFVSYMGGLTDIHVRLTETDRVIAQVPNHEGSVLPHVGDRVHVGWSAAAALFPAGAEEEATA
jgi:putative spermidine/putrescine transport system ATP-binding protein